MQRGLFFRRRGERLVGDQDDAGAAGLRHRDDLLGGQFMSAQVKNDRDRVRQARDKAVGLFGSIFPTGKAMRAARWT
jgi:hypothetical protein